MLGGTASYPSLFMLYFLFLYYFVPGTRTETWRATPDHRRGQRSGHPASAEKATQCHGASHSEFSWDSDKRQKSGSCFRYRTQLRVQHLTSFQSVIAHAQCCGAGPILTGSYSGAYGLIRLRKRILLRKRIWLRNRLGLHKKWKKKKFFLSNEVK